MLLKMICAGKKGVGLGIIGASYLPTYAGKGLIAAGSALVSVGATMHEYGEGICEAADIASWAEDNITSENLGAFMTNYGIQDEEKAVTLMYRMAVGDKAAAPVNASADIKVENPVQEKPVEQVVKQPIKVDIPKKNPVVTVDNNSAKEESVEEEEEPAHIVAARLC